MKRMAVYAMGVRARVPNLLVDIVTFIISYVLSIFLVVVILSIPPTSYIFCVIDPTIRTGMIPVLLFSFSIFCYLCCIYFDFAKFTKKRVWGAARFYVAAVVLLIIVAAVVLLISYLYGWKSREPLLELFGGILFWIFLLFMVPMFIVLVSIVRGWIFGHRINTHFKNACREIDNLKNTHSTDVYIINFVSEDYDSGIREIKNLLIRGIDPNGFFDSNTELSLNEILDELTFSMQYYLFYGGHEQIEAVKNHLEHMVGNFDEDYHVNTNQFMHEILRMYNVMDIYFKENNIFIERSIKFTDRVRGYLPQVVLAVMLLVISIITKDLIIN